MSVGRGERVTVIGGDTFVGIAEAETETKATAERKMLVNFIMNEYCVCCDVMVVESLKLDCILCLLLRTCPPVLYRKHSNSKG